MDSDNKSWYFSHSIHELAVQMILYDSLLIFLKQIPDDDPSYIEPIQPFQSRQSRAFPSLRGLVVECKNILEM